MSIQPVSFNAMSYNYPVARYNSQPIQNPSFRGIEEEEQQPKKKSHTGWWVAAGLAVAGIATYLLTRGKAKGAVEGAVKKGETVVKNAENAVNKAAEGTSTAEKTADKVVKNAENNVNKAAKVVNSTEKAASESRKVTQETPDEIMKRYNDAIEELKSELKRLHKQKAGIEDLINNALKKGKVANIDEEINQCEEVISRFKKESKNFPEKGKNASAYYKAKRQIAELQAQKVQFFLKYNMRQYASLKKQNAEKIEKLTRFLFMLIL